MEYPDKLDGVRLLVNRVDDLVLGLVHVERREAFVGKMGQLFGNLWAPWDALPT